jgi:thiamine pyrophosphate-dependent acetolactate synthase large subunit-like protein
MNKLEAVKALVAALKPEDLVVCCNGMIGRELYTVGDRPGNFYMIGSMGLALSIGLGLALARPTRRVIVLDGDGNVLMGMNALASVGADRPANLYHVVLDNQAQPSRATSASRRSRPPPATAPPTAPTPPITSRPRSGTRSPRPARSWSSASSRGARSRASAGSRRRRRS